jgi:hypothetical protein
MASALLLTVTLAAFDSTINAAPKPFLPSGSNPRKVSLEDATLDFHETVG